MKNNLTVNVTCFNICVKYHYCIGADKQAGLLSRGDPAFLF